MATNVKQNNIQPNYTNKMNFHYKCNLFQQCDRNDLFRSVDKTGKQ